MVHNVNGKCELCGIECKLTKHHLIPKSKGHSNKYSKIVHEEENFIWICRQCHDSIHSLHDENELRDNYSTLEKLKTDEELMKFVRWRQKHPEFNGHSKMSNERKR